MEGLIKEALKLCGFSTDDESVMNLKSWAIGHMVDDENGLEHLDLNDWLTTVGICSPTTILPSHIYFIKQLDDDLIIKMCERLRKKKLNATKREIYELCFEAINLNENLSKIKDLNHAINYVIIIFSKGEWETPPGFEETFPAYVVKSNIKIPACNNSSSTSATIH